MIVRYAASVALGVAVTFGLLFVMQLMIATGRDALTEPKTVRLVDFVRVERDSRVETRERKPERPPEPEQRPEAVRPDIDTAALGSLPVTMSAPAIELGASVTGGIGTVSDGEYLPIVKVAPIYPTRALMKRLEGYVMVRFTVTVTGAVKDVEVLESTAQIFEDPAVEAALKFKYKPRVINGTPVEVVGVRNKIVFTMDPAEQVAMDQ